MRGLRIGDKVKVRDGSYNFGIAKGKYTEHLDNLYSMYGDAAELEVIATGLSVATQVLSAHFKTDGLYCQVNDTLVADGNGNYWFTQERFLKLVTTHAITIDGKTIKLSDKSFENLKKQLTD